MLIEVWPAIVTLSLTHERRVSKRGAVSTENRNARVAFVHPAHGRALNESSAPACPRLLAESRNLQPSVAVFERDDLVPRDVEIVAIDFGGHVV
jgi:hypothetical protein